MIEGIGSVRSSELSTHGYGNMGIWKKQKQHRRGIPDSWMTMGYDQNRPKRWLFKAMIHWWTAIWILMFIDLLRPRFPARDDSFFFEETSNLILEDARFYPRTGPFFFAATHHRRCGARMEMMEILHFQCFLNGWSQLKMNLSPQSWELRYIDRRWLKPFILGLLPPGLKQPTEVKRHRQKVADSRAP